MTSSRLFNYSTAKKLTLYMFLQYMLVCSVYGIIQASFYRQDGKDVAVIEKIPYSTESTTALCTFKHEGGQVSTVADYTTAVNQGNKILVLPNLKENTYYFFRTKTNNSLEYSDSYIKQNQNWKIADAKLPVGVKLPADTPAEKKKESFMKRLDKKTKKLIKNETSEAESDDKDSYTWIIWVCFAVLGVILLCLIIGAFISR
ncbi:hypothetical protein CDIK_1022 [Cucumispora dikerogammari]|nr:hypothetical protein CDIK_1022 [Cucumispora dikerogammari]